MLPESVARSSPRLSRLGLTLTSEGRVLGFDLLLDPTASKIAVRPASLGSGTFLGPDPSGAGIRNRSGWMVPKTEIRKSADPISAGPADLRTSVKTIAAIPNGIARTPNLTNQPPLAPNVASGTIVQRQRTSPTCAEGNPLIAA